MRVEPVGGTLGAIVLDVDLTDLDDRTFDAVYQTWLDHLVVFFRGQQLDPAAHARFARRFGELEIHPLTEKLDDAHPESRCCTAIAAAAPTSGTATCPSRRHHRRPPCCATCADPARAATRCGRTRSPRSRRCRNRCRSSSPG